MRQLKSCLILILMLGAFSREVLAEALEPGSDLLLLYREMLSSNPSIGMAEAKARLGMDRERASFGQLLPQVSLGATLSRTQYTRQAVVSNYSGERHSLSLSQVLFDQAMWQKYRRASAVSQQYRAESSGQLEEATVNLLQRYFSVLAAEDQLALSQAEQRLVKRSLARVNSLFQQQLVSITDQLDLQARADELEAQVLESTNQVALARASLAEVVGRRVGGSLARLPIKATRIRDMELFDLGYWQQPSLVDNAQLKIRRAALDAAEADLKASKGSRYPRVSLSAAYQSSNIGYENALADKSESQVIAINFQVPIYSGGSTSAEVAAAEESVLMERLALESVQREVLKEVEVAFMNVHSYRARIEAGQLALESARKARLAAEKSFEYGIKNGIDVLEAVRNEFNARSRYLDSQYRFLINYAVLMKWAGRLDESIVEKLNSVLASG